MNRVKLVIVKKRNNRTKTYHNIPPKCSAAAQFASQFEKVEIFLAKQKIKQVIHFLVHVRCDLCAADCG